RESIFNVDTNTPSIDALIRKKNFEDLDIPVYVTALDLQNGDELYFNSGDIRTLCTASSALVPVFKPVSYDGKLLVDGGFENHLPYEPLKKYNLPLVGVNLHPLLKKKSRPRLMSYLKKVMAIRMFKTADRQKNDYDYYIESEKINKYSIFSFKKFDELYEMGYEDAKKVFSAWV
ncbi:MAG: hypothetical protein OQJ77_02120, partial [Thiovulaceae bacterium]|nr:hypothetical protein [Sulfurimonadaceae bacterium]